MSLAVKKILYASDAKESELAEAQEDLQSSDVEGGSDEEKVKDYLPQET